MAHEETALDRLLAELAHIRDSQAENTSRRQRLAKARVGLKLEAEALRTVQVALEERKEMHTAEASLIDTAEKVVTDDVSRLAVSALEMQSRLATQRKREDSVLASIVEQLNKLGKEVETPEKDDEPGG